MEQHQINEPVPQGTSDFTILLCPIPQYNNENSLEQGITPHPNHLHV